MRTNTIKVWGRKRPSFLPKPPGVDAQSGMFRFAQDDTKGLDVLFWDG
jgi:hypothetical protein